MADTETTSPEQEKKKKGGLGSDVVSGFATGLFSIPKGMAYDLSVPNAARVA